MIYRTFGEKLRYIRNDLKMTQKKFAEAIGIPQPTLCSYELGKIKPNIDSVVDIAEKLGVSVSELIESDFCNKKIENYSVVLSGDQIESMPAIKQKCNDVLQNEIRRIRRFQYCDHKWSVAYNAPYLHMFPRTDEDKEWYGKLTDKEKEDFWLNKAGFCVLCNAPYRYHTLTDADYDKICEQIKPIAYVNVSAFADIDGYIEKND